LKTKSDFYCTLVFVDDVCHFATLFTVVLICREILGSGSVRWSQQTVSDYILRQWFTNTVSESM